MNKKDKPLVSIVIPTYNRKNKLLRLLHSIFNSSFPINKLEIIVVDDNSNDNTYEVVKNFSNIKYIKHDKETLVAKSLNDGILASSSEYIFIIDDDNVIDKKTIDELYRTMQNDKKIGVAGPVTYYLSSPHVIQYAGTVYSKFMRRTIFLYHNKKINNKYLHGKIIEVDGIANSFMIRKSLALKAGLIPWKRIPWNGEDGYLQYKIKKMGYRIVVVGSAKVYHDARKENYFYGYNTMRFYYAIRSKIIFHIDLDNLFQKVTFLISLPLFVIYHLHLAAKMPQKKSKYLKAILHGLLDGLLRKTGIKYVGSK